MLLAWALVSLAAANAQQQLPSHKEAPAEAARQRYNSTENRFRRALLLRSERVRWVNRGDHATAVLYFHLYSNLRPEPSNSAGPASQRTKSRASYDITDVRSATEGTPLTYSIDDQGMTLRVKPARTSPSGKSAEVVVGFKGVYRRSIRGNWPDHARREAG